MNAESALRVSHSGFRSPLRFCVGALGHGLKRWSGRLLFAFGTKTRLTTRSCELYSRPTDFAGKCSFHWSFGPSAATPEHSNRFLAVLLGFQLRPR